MRKSAKALRRPGLRFIENRANARFIGAISTIGSTKN
jgi:hypothetical protein